MDFDDAISVLRSWTGDPVVIVLEPEGTVMRGRLAELDAEGIDGALFGVDSEQLTGVAVALFRDSLVSAARDGEALVVRQGRMTVTVTRG